MRGVFRIHFCTARPSFLFPHTIMSGLPSQAAQSRLAQLRGANTEEELLAYQKQFLQSHERPAAQVMRMQRRVPADAARAASAGIGARGNTAHLLPTLPTLSLLKW